MKVHLVRHGKAEKSGGDGPDELRPLTSLGLAQARSMAEQLKEARPDRLVSSPHLRCVQTLEPLARATGLRIESHQALAKGESPAKAAESLTSLGASRLVCCTHAELLEKLEGELVEAGVRVKRTAREVGKSLDEGMRRLAVLDMGSTSFHLLVADVASSGHLRAVDREREMLRLGAVLADHGHIPDEVCVRALDVARELRKKAESLGAESILPVATAALREADNGLALVNLLGQELGAPVRLLAGEEEARLIFSAFRRRVLLPPGGATLGADLGGGSLELAVGDDRHVHWETTLPLGVTRLHRALVTRDPMRRRDEKAIHELVRQTLEPVAAGFERHAPSQCVAVGGTARALGHLIVGRRGLSPVESVNQIEVGIEELRGLARDLVESSHDERLAMRGIRRRRADLLPTGALVLLGLAEMLRMDGYTLTDWGLREGVLFDAVGAASSDP